MIFLRLHLGLVLLFLYAPLLVLAAFSIDPAQPLRWYDALWQSEAVRHATLDSAIVALASAAIATALGTLLAVGLYGRRRRSPMLEALASAPLLLSEVALAVALLSFYAAVELSLGLHSIVLSHAVLTLGFVAAVVRRRLGHLDWRMLEASEDLGAGDLVTFGRITLPLILPAILAGALLALSLSLGDYLLAALTAGTEATTLPVLAYAMLRAGAEPQVSALGTVLLLVVFILVLLAERLSRPPRSR